MVRSKKSGRRVWKGQGLRVTQCYKQRLCVGAALYILPWHQTLGSHESRFHILPILLVGNPLVEHFLLVKRIFQALSAQLMNMHHIPPLALASAHLPFPLQLQIAGTFLFFFLNSVANAASVFVFVFNRLHS